MSLRPGQTLSHYRLINKIGAGGMGVVWKAEDTRLNRPVAIKFVTGGGVDSDERRTRFLREARLAASLNHPSICAIHQVAEVAAEEVDGVPEGTPYLAQELVEGRSLDQVLATATPLPLDDVLRIATQVADGLAAAHAQGIVHRDLKPGNVMVTPDDRVRILDFGLAKHLWAADPEDGVLTAAETISAELTRAGVVLGTVAYMSPEQARGEELDHRSDVFSFGIMLYEMVCGQRPFRGETSETTRLKIIEAEPEPLPATSRIVPAELERIIWRCLRKKPGDRFNNTRDLVLTLEDLRHETASGRGLRAAGASSHERRRAGILPWVIAAVATVAAVVGWLVRPAPEPTVSPVVRFTVQLPEGERLAASWRRPFTLSPDGGMLAFVSGPVNEGNQLPESSRLYLQRFDQQDPRAIPGSEGARWPVFSPDGRSIVFSAADQSLKRLDLDGGELMTLCECGPLFGLAWGADGRIIYATVEGGLHHLPATGGEPQPLTRLHPENFESSHRLPHLLPDGKTILYTVTRTQETGDMQTHAVVVESLENGERKILLEGAADARYSPTGHLLFAREGRLMAAPFDRDRLQITGPEVPLLEGVAHALHLGDIWADTGAALLALSASGTLAYVPGSVAPPQLNEPVWVDRQGHQTPLGLKSREYWYGRVSRDGTQVLLTVGRDGASRGDVWLFDLERGTMRRQTFEGENKWGIWGPDEGSLTFESNRDGSSGLYTKPVDSGPGGAQRLADGTYPSSWSADGTRLAFVKFGELNDTTADIWVLERGGESRPVLRNPYFDGYPEFSPDGRWLLYCNNESRQTRAYIRPFPGPGRAVQISTSYAVSPGWSRDGSEIFYLGDDDFYYAVPLHREGTQLRPGAPTRLFESLAWVVPVRGWDVAPDGRFLMFRHHESSIDRRRAMFASERIHVVLNWTQEVERAMSVLEQK